MDPDADSVHLYWKPGPFQANVYKQDSGYKFIAGEAPKGSWLSRYGGLDLVGNAASWGSQQLCHISLCVAASGTVTFLVDDRIVAQKVSN